MVCRRCKIATETSGSTRPPQQSKMQPHQRSTSKLQQIYGMMISISDLPAISSRTGFPCHAPTTSQKCTKPRPWYVYMHFLFLYKFLQYIHGITPFRRHTAPLHSPVLAQKLGYTSRTTTYRKTEMHTQSGLMLFPPLSLPILEEVAKLDHDAICNRETPSVGTAVEMTLLLVFNEFALF